MKLPARVIAKYQLSGIWRCARGIQVKGVAWIGHAGSGISAAYMKPARRRRGADPHVARGADSHSLVSAINGKELYSSGYRSGRYSPINTKAYATSQYV